MQDGIMFLWLLALSVSSIYWIYLKILWIWGNHRKSRRQVSGCELARRVLDCQGPNRIVVTPISKTAKSEFGFSLDRFFLNEKVYYGQHLFDLTEALFRAARHLELSGSVIPMEWRSPDGKFWQGGIFLSWILVAGGLLWHGVSGLTALGQILLIATFFMALAYLAGDWKSAERALSCLVSLEGFGVDEKVRMKKILEAIRWISLAGLITAPWQFLNKRIRLELSKPERVR